MKKCHLLLLGVLSAARLELCVTVARCWLHGWVVGVTDVVVEVVDAAAVELKSC